MKFRRLVTSAAFVGSSHGFIYSPTRSHAPFRAPDPLTPTKLSVHDDAFGVVDSDAAVGMTRRRAVKATGSVFLSLALFELFRGEADAFSNRIPEASKYDDRPKRRGPQPKDLGVKTRKDMIGDEHLGLKNCGPAPNCFCSTDSYEDDPEHNIPAWTWPKNIGNNKEEAFLQLKDAVNAYKPGQGGIDGGGFEIKQFDPKAGYLYVQFESLKAGYVDDLELAVVDGKDERSVQVRSSSRVGYLDFGVNAKRLNYIANDLRAKGWDAPGVDMSTHRDYAMQNGV